MWHQRRHDAHWVRDCYDSPIVLPDDAPDSIVTTTSSLLPDSSPIISVIRHWPLHLWSLGIVPTAFEIAPYTFGLITACKWRTSVSALFGVWASIEGHRSDLIRSRSLPPDILEARRSRRQRLALDMLKPLKLSRADLFPTHSAPSQSDLGRP